MSRFFSFLKSSAVQPLRLGLCLGLWLSAALPTTAQVRGDTTLPTPTQVQRQGNEFEITGGTQRGGNLFHSFERFSPGDRTVTFRNVDTVERLITRVTGGTPSEINGILRLLQSDGQISPADFFLINPSGILFGENARLDVGGSVIFSTAERIRFADGTQFSARNPQASPLLTVSIPTGLQFGPAPAPIVNASFSLAANFSRALRRTGYFGTSRYAGLSVLPDRAIALIGGNLDFPGGEITAPGGRIELGSVAQAGTVELVPIAQGWSVDYSNVQAFGQIHLTGFADISANGDRGGTVRLRASEIRLDEASYISADTLGSLAGGRITIRGDRLTLLNGSQIFANTRSSGPAGRIDLLATSQIQILGAVVGSDGPESSGVFVRVQDGATGNGGRIVLTTGQLNLLDGGQISLDTIGNGRPGSLQILADEINIAGVALDGQGNPIAGDLASNLAGDLNLPVPSTLSAAIFGSQSFQPTDAIPSQIEIQTRRLRVQDGATIQTSTFGVADAGNLSIWASERVEVQGLSPATPDTRAVPAGIFSQSGGTPGTPYIFAPGATGRGGDLSIATGELVVRDGAYIATGSFDANPNALGAGNLTLATRSATLENQGNIVANTNSGVGGNLSLTAQDYLLLRRNSQISTSAGIAGQGGDGGNITLRADFILSVLTENNDITANAFTGDGGAVNIFTRGITGILPQPQLTPQSDITATSERGNSGTITITTPPSTDPTQGVTELPAAPVDASRLIAQRCAASSAIAADRSAFVATGRGGLPPGPNHAFDLPSVRVPWAEAAPASSVNAPIHARPPAQAAALDAANQDTANNQDAASQDAASQDAANQDAANLDTASLHTANLTVLPPPDDPDSRTSPLTLREPSDAALSVASRPLQEARGWRQTATGEVILLANLPEPSRFQDVQPLPPGCAAPG
ncbi:S-layer family protein [Thermoleptolyngbya oregonensis NK1-22]|uniref:S-layer family protein n=1 Tax=Thermoleptolyngbya oregonensis NK1-22 TaxID=2547457 RepID=A0AA96Y1P0_9CYAN|nr:S-layer family protein [Thermoleptolyngbya oregonensis]WOB41776.1 S-layer family protein [Thermoleptolyngbya oregonensis NK1-22]